MNTQPGHQRRNWQVNLLLTAGVMTTVLLALILAQLDALQARAALDRPGIPIVNIQATAIAVGNVIPLNLNPEMPVPVTELVNPVPDDLNPRPEFITGVSEEGVIFTVCGVVPEGWLLYTLQPGETLASLAAGTQTSAAELMAANCLTDGQITAGMQLLVPQQPVASLCGPPQWWVRYQVRPGDTIGALAANRGTTADEVLRANCRDTFDLQAGQSIFLPPGFSSGGSAPIVPQPSLTPLPTATAIPTLAPLPTATTIFNPPPPSPTAPVVIISPVPPTATAPALPTAVPPTSTPQPPPTQPPTEPPPTALPPTALPPTQPPPTQPPPTATLPPPPPTEPPPTATAVPPPTDPPPTEPPPPTDPPPTEEPPPEEGG